MPNMNAKGMELLRALFKCDLFVMGLSASNTQYQLIYMSGADVGFSISLFVGTLLKKNIRHLSLPNYQEKA